MSHIRVRGKRWTIKSPGELDSQTLGQCCWETQTLWMPDRSPTKEDLDTVTHELCHAQCPSLTERQVRGLSRLLTNYLWSRGWRMK